MEPGFAGQQQGQGIPQNSWEQGQNGWNIQPDQPMLPEGQIGGENTPAQSGW
jgi:hypothetical protein